MSTGAQPLTLPRAARSEMTPPAAQLVEGACGMASALPAMIDEAKVAGPDILADALEFRGSRLNRGWAWGRWRWRLRSEFPTLRRPIIPTSPSSEATLRNMERVL